jgi:hypothetical protein
MSIIEGLLVDVKGKELQKHCHDRCEHHDKKKGEYAEKLSIYHETKAKMAKEGQITGMSDKLDVSNFKGNVDVNDLQRKASQHDRYAAFFYFVAEHLVLDATYRLTVEELNQLEFVEKSRY